MTKNDLKLLSDLLDMASDTFMNIVINCHEAEQKERYFNKALKCAEVRLSLKHIRPSDHDY